MALASEASEDGDCLGVPKGCMGDTNGELTLVDIYDMCVGQVAERPSPTSLFRSRQPSGDPPVKKYIIYSNRRPVVFRIS